MFVKNRANLVSTVGKRLYSRFHCRALRDMLLFDILFAPIFFISALLIPLSSRIHTDQQWVADNIPFELRFVQMIPVNDNIMTKDSLLAVSCNIF